MNKKVLGVIGAFVLALVGTMLLVSYVSRAEDRALAGEELVEVYVVNESVGAGTPAAELTDAVVVEKVPEKVRASTAVTDLADLEGLVTSVDLDPGEPLLSSRFVAPQAFEVRPEGVSAPSGMVEVTVALAAERAVGGLVAPGQTVAVISSFEPFETDPGVVEVNGEAVALPVEISSQTPLQSPNTSHLILHKVLVTSVQIDPNQGGVTSSNDDDDDEENAGPAEAPGGELLVTLAVTPADAERLVFTAEFGHVWLAAEGPEVPEDTASIQTRGSVYIPTDEKDVK
jgi:pilus assembly protein CpaB